MNRQVLNPAQGTFFILQEVQAPLDALRSAAFRISDEVAYRFLRESGEA